MINKKFKDSVFTLLFEDPVVLRELYCAIEGVTLPPDVPVSINTLENVLYMDVYNDISFEIGGKLIVLIEHQSTINPNMSLRMLLYVARILERTVEGRSIYSGRKLTIPWPEFYVLYNGEKPYSDTEILRLSDLYENPQIMGLPEKDRPLLELEVKVININEGRNKDIVDRCKKLSEYSAFIGKIYANMKQYKTKEEAINEAVKYCRKNAILKEFLELHATEVLNMLLTEWNTEDAKKVWYEDGLLDGREEGIEKGQNIILELLEQGMSLEDIKIHLKQTDNSE